MAGDLPKRPASGRKQWNLQDGSRNQLRVLRNQLASDGCPESQVVLAKQLLDGSQQYHSHSEKKENESLGVYWLIKASQQGNEEATRLLKTCLKTGKGISEHNFLDVKSCINMTQNEKLTRKAAREIFASLSNGRDYITTDQLQKEILLIERRKNSISSESLENIPKDELAKNGEESNESNSEHDWTIRLESKISGEKLTEDNLVSAAIDYSQGILPLVNKSLDLDPNFQLLNDVPYFYRSILHPLLALKKFHIEFLKFFCRKLEILYSTPDVRLFLILVIYSIYNIHSYIYILPIVLYYISFIFMIVTTFQMLQNQRDFEEYRLWSGLFLCYSGNDFNAEQSEHQYLKRKLKPFGQFFLALLVNLLIYSSISEHWTPDSELTVVSFLFTFWTLFGFMPKKCSKISCEGTILFSFAITVLAKYPYESDPIVSRGWNYLDLKIPLFIGDILRNCMDIFSNFRPVLFIAMPFFLIQLASKNNWRGTYKYLIPHCVTLSWLQMCIIGSQGATTYGLLRGVLAIGGLVMFVPLIGLTSIIVPAATLAKWIITSHILYGISIFFVVAFIIFFISFHLAQTNINKYTAVVQIIILITSSLTLCNMMYENNSIAFMPKDEELKYLPWEIYRKFCYESSWDDENIALTQLNCAGLENSLIFWDGYIHSIKIKSVSNVFVKILDFFPENMKIYLRCLFGEEVSTLKCQNFQKNYDECEIFHRVKRTANICTLEKYNNYVFEISIKMSVGIWGKNPDMLVLVLDNHFQNITMKLKSGDHIWFRGKLFNNQKIGADGILGGYKPHVSLIELGCHSCSQKNIDKVSKEDPVDSFQYLYAGLKFILNVFMKPIIILE